MDKLKMHSKDKTQENFEILQRLFPNAVTETITGYDEDGKAIVERAIDKDVLQQEINAAVVEGKDERYQFTWPDKKRAIVSANAPINKTLRPCREESVDFDNTENLYIEGDNLEVLKLLQETYLGKIKMIYIDPPYNTGHDFVYNDKFSVSPDEWDEMSGELDEYGNRLTQNTESNGRFHTDWLNMIYPRLKIARDLLADDGIILIQSGEQEIDNLKKITTELFGADSFIENYVWESTFRPDNSSPVMRRNAEYVLCYAKRKETITRLIGEIKEGLPSLTKSSMRESVLRFPPKKVITYLPDGQYSAGKRDSYELLDDVEVKNGIIINEFCLKGHMIWSQSNLDKELSEGTEIIIKSNGFVPYTQKAGDSIMAPAKLIPNSLVGDILSANAEFAKLFEEKVFSYPKPVTLLKYLVKFFEEKDFIVMDFFSGSSTTAHAVMSLNTEDGGNRRFIMVQLPENLDSNLKFCTNKQRVVLENAIALCNKHGFEHTICSIAKERIRRAGSKIKAETNADIDYGFRGDHPKYCVNLRYGVE